MPFGFAEGALITTGLLNYDLNKDNAKNQDKWNQIAREDQRYYFDESMDRGIQRKVADARAAGISPLAAMGSPGASMPNIPIGRTSSTGPMDGLVNAIAALVQTQQQENLMDKEIKLMELRHEGRNQRAGYAPTGVPLEMQAEELPPVFNKHDASVKPIKFGEVNLLSEEASQSMEGFWAGLATIVGTGYGYGKHYTGSLVKWLKKEMAKGPPLEVKEFKRKAAQKIKEYNEYHGKRNSEVLNRDMLHQLID